MTAVLKQENVHEWDFKSIVGPYYVPDKTKPNFILMSDSYKYTHANQYPKGTQYVYSYLESRGGKYDKTLFFGLQYYLKKYLNDVVIENWMIDEAEEFLNEHFGHNYFNREGWEYIVNNCGGKLPIEIKAVDEGTIVPTKNVLMTIQNTDPNCWWLTNFVETLLMKIWSPTTVATQSYYIKQLIDSYAKKTGCSVSPFHLHDFGYRGVSSEETAAINGAAHLVNFMGTDTLAGIRMLQKYYHSGVCGYSVIAAEHSTITSWGREHESEAYENIIDNAPDDAIISLVADSYDIYNAVENIFCGTLKDKIIKRTGRTVIRPDSGNPAEVSLKILQILDRKMGSTINEKGYKTINYNVGIIYGDGINYDSINEILKTITDAGFSTDNIVFGMGGVLLQQVNRDTQQFACKCSAIYINDEWHDVYKQPVGDSGKNSKRGRLSLVFENGRYQNYPYEMVDLNDYFQEPRDGKIMLKTVFKDGEIYIDHTLEEIRNHVNAQ